MPTAAFPFFSLPPEIRLQIYGYLLSSSNADGLTTISRPCSSNLICVISFANDSYRAAGVHKWANSDCICNSRPFYLLDSHGTGLTPQILRVSKQAYNEALPLLYKRRTFVAEGNRAYASESHGMRDSWFLMDRFLRTLPPAALFYIRQVRLPLVLGIQEQRALNLALLSISETIPWREKIELAICPRFISARTILAIRDAQQNNLESSLDDPDDPRNDGVFGQYSVGPIMRIIHLKPRISAVNFIGLDPMSFSRVKTVIETRMSVQIGVLDMERMKRQLRRLGNLIHSLDRQEDGFCIDSGCGIGETIGMGAGGSTVTLVEEH